MIFAGNHQLAILDALLIICTCRKQPSTLTSAFIFKSPLLAKMLSLLKLMPVYRIRDGVSSLQKNEEIFSRCDRLLAKGEAVSIFPEANHHAVRKLRTLTKGISRLAFHAMDSGLLPPGLVIVPVGINYSNQYNFNSRVLVNYGLPLEVGRYMELYRSNPQQGMTELKEKVAESIRPLIIDIRSDVHYSSIEFIRQHFREETAVLLQYGRKTAVEEFIVDKTLIDILDTVEEKDPEALNKLQESVNLYRHDLKEKNLRDWVIRKGRFPLPGLFAGGIFQLLFLPFFLAGTVLNAPFYFFHKIFTRTINDLQFLPGVRFAISVLLFPVYNLFLLAVLSLVSGHFLLSLAVVVALPVLGYASLHHYIRFKKWSAGLRFRLALSRNDPAAARMVATRGELKEWIADAIKKYGPGSYRKAGMMKAEAAGE